MDSSSPGPSCLCTSIAHPMIRFVNALILSSSTSVLSVALWLIIFTGGIGCGTRGNWQEPGNAWRRGPALPAWFDRWCAWIRQFITIETGMKIQEEVG